MGSTPRKIKNIPATKHRTSKPRPRKPTFRRTCSVSDKLEALKNLVPPQEIDGAATSSTDKLFKETADYILLLQTQVSILQKLVDFYGSSSSSSSSSPVQQ